MTLQPMSKPPAEDETTLDDVIQKIDESLPAIHRLCRIQKKQKRAPTDRLPPITAKQAKARFKELCAHPILNEEGTDIQETPLSKINGFHPDDDETAAAD